jgi:rsbT co-antagonist protein RsbR
MSPQPSHLADVVARREGEILEEWLRLQRSSAMRRSDLIDDQSLREQSRQILAGFRKGLEQGGSDVSAAPWSELRDTLLRISRDRARAGFTARDTALFVLSLKQALQPALKAASASAEVLASETWNATTLVDALSVLTVDEFQKGREEVINRQQQDLMELSTPVVRLWEGVLALPLIGTLDSARTQVVMESLLQSIVDTGATIAIIDITGVPTVDTLVAQHLLKTVAAARLMGADCIISGIRPQIAQTIVHLGVELGEVTTKASLADAFALALRRNGLMVTRAAAPTA